jgi:signal transduction histidine kinase
MKATLSTRRMFGSGMLVLVLAGILGTAMWIWQDLRFELWNRGERGLEGLQVFGTLPDFSFVERSGRTVTLADFRGKVWIANFIYTHCTDTCPLQSARLATLQDDFAGERDLRTANMELGRLSALRRDFLQIVLHDLKSPLVTIQGFAGHIAQDVAEGHFDRLPDFTGRITDAANRMTKIIDDLLDFKGEEKTLGKPVLSDFRDGRFTLPLLHDVFAVRLILLTGKSLDTYLFILYFPKLHFLKKLTVNVAL